MPIGAAAQLKATDFILLLIILTNIGKDLLQQPSVYFGT